MGQFIQTQTIPLLVSFLFNILVHAIIIIGVAIQLRIIIKMTFSVGNDVERLVRAGAFSSGLLVVLGGCLSGPASVPRSASGTC